MDYKKVIPNQSMRFAILNTLNFLPDRIMLTLQYLIKQNRLLHLSHPRRYTEKLQWYKLYHRDPLMQQCSDKYAVRDYIVSKGLETILVPLLGIYNSVDEIDFDALPEQFVLKTTNNSHTVIIVDTKEQLDIEKTKNTLQNWLTHKSPNFGREWAYTNIPARIICEQLLPKDDNNDLIDYKFLCFNGIPSYVYVMIQRFLPGGMLSSMYDMDFNLLPYRNVQVPAINKKLNPPENFEDMIEIARKLSEDFPQVRVDLYNVAGKIYFGELTFYCSSGYQTFDPDEFDYVLGDQFKI